MKFFIAFFLIAVCVAQCLSVTLQGQLNANQQNLDSLRVRKAARSSYGGSSSGYSAPPCPTNYLFSCGPQLQPVACAQGGYQQQPQGAYSENIPRYVAPQLLTPRQYAFPQFAVPVVTEV